LLTLGLVVIAGCQTEEPETVEREIVELESLEPKTELPETITNSLGMKFKLIPAGEFMMGSPESTEELVKAFGFPHELLRWHEHKVQITKPFYLGVTEVTQEQYEKIMGENPSSFSKAGKNASQVTGIDTSNFPVERVTWDDAVEFCKKLSAKEGVAYRLPTEAEWEYACRAGSTTRYCFGDDESQSGEYAWFANNSNRGTHPVGTKKPNAWGLYDMHGNVWEWCSDWYDLNYYLKSPKDDPTGPATGSARVLRGGCWFSDAGSCRSSFRLWFPPSDPIDIAPGFRIARSPISNQPQADAQSDSR
jgi:formylglycine-generating enzyme required for sulfatase activity